MGILKTAVSKRGEKQPSPSKSSAPAEPEAPTKAEAKAGSAGPSADDLVRVREILFGNDLAEQKNELAALEGKLKDQFDRAEAQLQQHLADASEAMNNRLASVERSIGSKLNEFSTRLRTEADQRVENQKRFEEQLANQRAELDAVVGELREGAREAEADLRNQLLAQGSLLSSSIQKHHEEALSRMSDTQSEMRRSKVDRSTVADMFATFAEKLREDVE